MFDAADELFLGATTGTNNTGELSAIGFACRYALQEAKHNQHELRIFYDSEYAASIASGTFNANKNVELASRVKALLSEVIQTRRVTFHKVKGHSNNIFNDRADANANKGAAGQRNIWGSFVQPLNLGGESESELQDLHSSASPSPAVAKVAPGNVSLSSLFLRATSVGSLHAQSSAASEPSGSPSVSVSLNSGSSFNNLPPGKAGPTTSNVVHSMHNNNNLGNLSTRSAATNAAQAGSVESFSAGQTQTDAKLLAMLREETDRREAAERRVAELEAENHSLRERLRVNVCSVAAVSASDASPSSFRGGLSPRRVLAGKRPAADSIIALDSSSEESPKQQHANASG